MKAIYSILKIKLVWLLSAVVVLSSCTATKESDDFYDKNAEFFDVVYQTRATRFIGSTPWIAVEGYQRLKFEYADASSTDTSSGKFTLQLEAYREKQLSNQNLCSGGYKGTFTIQDLASDTNTEDPTAPYDPLSTYNPGYTTDPSATNSDEDEIDPSTGKPKKNKVYYFVFNLTVTESSFNPACSSSIRPPSNFLLTVVRYPNGDLIITNQQRSLDLYFLPELVNKTTSP